VMVQAGVASPRKHRRASAPVFPLWCRRGGIGQSAFRQLVLSGYAQDPNRQRAFKFSGARRNAILLIAFIWRFHVDVVAARADGTGRRSGLVASLTPSEPLSNLLVTEAPSAPPPVESPVSATRCLRPRRPAIDPWSVSRHMRSSAQPTTKSSLSMRMVAGQTTNPAQFSHIHIN
jgi:hypothetical protein